MAARLLPVVLLLANFVGFEHEFLHNPYWPYLVDSLSDKLSHLVHILFYHSRIVIIDFGE